jgi:glycosyltransferase involved in cell wall biosynthesis
MKVLWFEISVPGRYKSDKTPVSGWQDSLEQIVRTCKDIELTIAFEGTEGMLPKEVDGVKYLPLVPHYSFWDKKYRNEANRWNKANKVVPLAVKCVEEVKPDIIHCFGTEWEFGQVAIYTDIPVVIHMQGCIAPYNDALYPPGYSISDRILQAGFNLKKQWHIWRERKFNDTWEDMERSNFKAVSNYMGRTEWDRQLVDLFHPGAKYFHVEEALRPSFIDNAEDWKPKEGYHKIRLMTTGCSSHWKGMDTLLKTAHVLKETGLDFEWLVAGNMAKQKEVERKEKLNFADNNVKILGFTGPDELRKLLLSSDIYVHTAYIENSPNSICEAQYLGLPVISTNVGGIPSLVIDGEEGKLVPANSCYNMAYEIISLAKDVNRQNKYSEATKLHARKRHDPCNILAQLLQCYRFLLNE